MVMLLVLLGLTQEGRVLICNDLEQALLNIEQ